MRLPCKSICLGCLSTFFFSILLFLLSGGLDFIGHPLVFHGCRALQRNKFSFHQKYLCYLEYLLEGNGFLSNILTFGKFQKIYFPEMFWERLLPIYFFTKEHPLKKSNKRTHIPFLIASVLIFRIVLYWFNTISY